MLNYRLEGDGAALVLIHGFGVTFSIWDRLAPLLRSHFRLVLVELPGLGRSPRPAPATPYYAACAEALVELRQHLGLDQWAVLSYSSGTRAAEAYVQRDAPHVTHIVFLCPAYTSGWRALNFRAALALDTRWPALGNWALSGQRLRTLIRLLGFNGQNLPLVNEWHYAISAQSMGELKATLHNLPRAGASRFNLPSLPTLFIWGTRDVIAARPRRPGPRDRFILADHSAPLRAAPAIADILLPFFQNS